MIAGLFFESGGILQLRSRPEYGSYTSRKAFSLAAELAAYISLAFLYFRNGLSKGEA